MTARTWDEGDPEPADRPAVVDSDGVTHVYGPDEDGSGSSWRQLLVTHYPNSSIVSGGHLYEEWDEILADYGPVREATAEEAATVTHRWPAPQNLLAADPLI